MSAQNTRLDERLLYAVGFLYFAISHISRILLLIGIPRQIPYAFFFLLLGVFFLKNLKSIVWLDVLYYALVGGLVPGVLKYGRYTNGPEYVLSFFVFFLPAYLFFRLFSSRGEQLEKCFVAAGWLSALYLLPYYAICLRGSTAEEYSMEYAYWIAFPICVFIHRYWETKKIAYLLLALVMYVTLVLAGCRGALLLTTLFAGFDFIEQWNQKLTTKTVLWIITFVLAVTTVMASLDSILSFLGQYSSTSRNIQKLLGGNYFVSTTREPIYERCKLLLDNRPEGYGPFASRWLIPDHNYPHSLRYELQLDFGKMVGETVFVLLWGITVFNLVAYRKKKLAPVVNYLAIVGMGSLNVSASYYYKIYVPAMIGLFVSHFYAPAGGRRQALWSAHSDRAANLAPRQTGELRPPADSPASESGSRKALAEEAFPEPTAQSTATAEHVVAAGTTSARSASQPALGHSAASFSASPDAATTPSFTVPSATISSVAVPPATDPSDSTHHHRRHHGGRRTPTRRFFDKTLRYLPWVLIPVILSLAFTYGVPFAKRAWGQHCMDRGFRLAESQPEAAFRSFQSAYKSMTPGSDIALMVCRQLGIGCVVDSDAAAAAFESCYWTYASPHSNLAIQQLLQRLADAQDPNAQYLLGRMHEEGRSFAQADPAAARRCMEQALSHGQPQAFQWMVARARGGDIDAQVLLGRLYLDGNGLAGYDDEAVRWVLVAATHGAEGYSAWLEAQARAGNPTAQYTLGHKAELRERKAGARDFATALDWYRQAAAQGHVAAQVAVKRLSGNSP